jgi:hypothetical protein
MPRKLWPSKIIDRDKCRKRQNKQRSVREELVNSIDRTGDSISSNAFFGVGG